MANLSILKTIKFYMN